jgi:hypothetical protein
MARGDGNTDAERWPELFKRAGLPPPPFDSVHPGFGHFYDGGQGIRDAPPYYNYGFVLGTREAMGSIAGTVEEDYRTAAAYMKTDLAAQAGLALSIVRHQVAYASLPMRFNMWSWPAYLRAFPEEFSDLRLLHYLHPEVFSKSRNIENVTVLKNWLADNRDSGEPMTRCICGWIRFPRCGGGGRLRKNRSIGRHPTRVGGGVRRRGPASGGGSYKTGSTDVGATAGGANGLFGGALIIWPSPSNHVLRRGRYRRSGLLLTPLRSTDHLAVAVAPCVCKGRSGRLRGRSGGHQGQSCGPLALFEGRFPAADRA